MKEIKLTQDLWALVDDSDYEVLMKYKWCASFEGNGYYAVTSGGNTTILMHRLLMGASKGQQVDHINHVTLDNRRSNLRLCSNAENHANQKLFCTNQTGYKGVKKMHNRWRAQIKVNQKDIHLGYYTTPEDAARAYDNAATEYFGAFAYTNAMIAEAAKGEQ